MNVIEKNKWLKYGIVLEFLVVASFCNANLFLKYTTGMSIVYVLFVSWLIFLFIYRVKKHKKAPKWWAAYRWSEDMVLNFGILLLAFVLAYGVDTGISLFQNKGAVNKVTASQAKEIAVRNRGKSILEQADLLHQLSPENYSNLTVREKLEVLHRVVQIEAEYLGIETPGLRCATLSGNTVGVYLKDENVVVLSEAYMAYEETILRGLLHEMYHAYQSACVNQVNVGSELLVFRQIEQWRKEYKSFSATNEGYLEYYVKSIEETAREYAEDRLKEYGKLIVLGNQE